MWAGNVEKRDIIDDISDGNDKISQIEENYLKRIVSSPNFLDKFNVNQLERLKENLINQLTWLEENFQQNEVLWLADENGRLKKNIDRTLKVIDALDYFLEKKKWINWKKDNIDAKWNKKWKDIEQKEKDKKYTLSKEDFNKYFKWDNFEQRNIWDCWLLATIDSLTHLKNYEELIRTSVKVENNIFYFKLPLWDKNAKYIKVDLNKVENEKQISLNGETLSLINTPEKWLSALVYAYWKHITWLDRFDIWHLTAWNETEAMYNLVYWLNLYLWFVSDPNKEQQKYYIDKFINTLKQINLEEDMLTIWVNQLDGYNKLWNAQKISNHATSVESINKDENGNIISITVSNPWDSNKSYEIKKEDFWKYIHSFELWTKKKFPKLLDNKKYSVKRSNERRTNTDDTSTLNGLIQHTWDVNMKLRIERKDVIVMKKWEKLVVSSWWNETNIDVKQHKVMFWWYEFKLDEVEKNKVYETLPKIANFVNKMLHDYIKPKKLLWKKPFKLDGVSLEVDYDFNNIRKYIDSDVTVLRSLSYIGINTVDDRKRFVVFLNDIWNKEKKS